MEEFLTAVLDNVDGYWSATFKKAGLPDPQVKHVWVEPGKPVPTACGTKADDNAAFYCSADDTIYVAVRFASQILRGVRHDLPGERFGQGHAVGDFGVAYVVAHEFAHNLQYELGWFQAFQTLSATPFELQADCMAGVWGNAVYREGLIQPGDVGEAISTAAAVGDFDTLNPQHHGTPAERVDAWLTGYRSGDPAVCQAYLPV
jgi:predicted metalloprotease